MDFINRMRELANRAEKQLPHCETEEATKNALVLPFISALGYDVFNPTEVLPEFTADVGIKKGEKVDYAILKEKAPLIIFECKRAGTDLSQVHASQLYRYFASVPAVRFGILTNGINYRFYSDLDAPNRMDDKPFFEFNILDIQERQIIELKKFTKPSFNLDEILTTANELKYTAAIQKLIAKEFESPSEELVRFFTKQVYTGSLTQAVRGHFRELTQTSLIRFLNDSVNERLKSALQVEQKPPAPPVDAAPSPESAEGEPAKKQVVTTDQETEAFFVVKSILRSIIPVKRIIMRDAQTYCGILLDDNNRKPIIRLYFNSDKLRISLFDQAKQEERITIEGIDDIYKYAPAPHRTGPVVGYSKIDLATKGNNIVSSRNVPRPCRHTSP